MDHKLKKQEIADKKAAREALKQSHTPPNSVAALRARVALLEKVCGTTSNES